MPEKGTRKRGRETQPTEPTETIQSVFDETMKLVKEIPEDQLTKLRIESDALIFLLSMGELWGLRGGNRGLNFILKDRAYRWVQSSIMPVVAKRHENNSLSIIVGAGYMGTHRQSGFSIVADSIENAEINVQSNYLPADNEFKWPRYDMRNEHWKTQHNFIEGLNIRGREFIGYLKQEPAINKLKLARSLIQQAVQPIKFTTPVEYLFYE